MSENTIATRLRDMRLKLGQKTRREAADRIEQLERQVAELTVEPHPPTRHCMCAQCAPSFETDCLGQPLDEKAIAALSEFRAAMQNEAIPAIVETINKRQRAAAEIEHLPLSARLTNPQPLTDHQPVDETGNLHGQK